MTENGQFWEIVKKNVQECIEEAHVRVVRDKRIP